MSQAETGPAGAGESPAQTETSEVPTTTRGRYAVPIAVLAALLGLYELIAGFALTGAVATMDGASAAWWVTGPLHLVLGGLLIYGSVATVRNRPNGILVPVAAVAVIAILVSAVMKIADGVVPLELVVVLLYAALAYLVRRAG
ncbi:hypothetical protein H7J88_07340 [Mycolicibacterium flavescens]|uniref:Uncharacterized protein n=1 Tax=Mycolicibacterium flavescens TaxID=1776 RepID=A0A1E3RQ12_MYCFV|nr:hypothetical protein [Mycolicibacterium flavescens]MCV7279458.1 hypothetical protein [Mycolicibacterium flavescens]ODQ91938.1 hypothetical protein BHQ18_03580 [Mycolicibacterium flavescens]